MKISCLYGKNVLCADGKTGYVISVLAEDGKLSCLVCADQDEREFAISAENIKQTKDKIVCRGNAEAKKRGQPVRLGKPVYDCGGKLIGKLTDFTAEKNELVFAHAGNKKFPYADIAVGDVVIIKSGARVLKSDVKKDGKIMIRRGTPLTPEILEKAQSAGEYVQTNLKTLI